MGFRKKIALILLFQILLISSIINPVLSEPINDLNECDIENIAFKQEIILPIHTFSDILEFYPIDVRVVFENTCWGVNENWNSIKVAYDDGSGLIELDSQVYDIEFEKENKIKSCSLVFLLPEFINGNEKYYVLYDSKSVDRAEYKDYVEVEDSYYYYEPVPGQKIQFDYFKVRQDENIEYAIIQKGELVGNPSSQFVARLKRDSKQFEMNNVDQLAVFDMRYGINEYPYYYGTCSAKEVKKKILVDGNLMIRVKIESTSPDASLKTENIYTYYYSPTEIKRLFVDVNHKVLKTINIENPVMFDGSYAGIATTKTRSTSIPKMNFGNLLPNIHIYDQNENIKNYLIPSDPSSTREYILSTQDDIDLGSKAWISLDDPSTGKAHGLIVNSNKNIVNGPEDGIQIKSYVEQTIKLPGLESDSGSIYFMRNSYERGNGHNTVLSVDLNVNFGIEFISIENEGFERINKESGPYQELFPIVPIKREKIIDDKIEEKRYSLTVFVHLARTDPLGPFLSFILGERVLYTSVEVHKDGEIKSSGAISRIPLNEVDFDFKNKRIFQIIKSLIGTIDWGNFTIFEKIYFPSLEPGKYSIKVFKERPTMFELRRFVGFESINLEKDEVVHLFCRPQGKIKLSAVDQNNNHIKDLTLRLKKDEFIVSEESTDSNGSAVIAAPIFPSKTFTLNVIYDGFLIEKKNINLGLFSNLIAKKEQVTFDRYSLNLDIKDKWGFAPEIDLDPSVTSRNMLEPIIINAEMIGEGKYRFNNLYSELYNLKLSYKSFEFERDIYLGEDKKIDIFFPAEYFISFNVMDSYAYDITKGQILVKRNNKLEKTIIDKNGKASISIPPGSYEITVLSSKGKVIAKQNIEVRGHKEVDILSQKDSILHLLIIVISISSIFLFVGFLIKKRKIFISFRLIVVALFLISLVSPWWTLNGINESTKTETNTYLIPPKIITSTSSEKFLGGEVGQIPSELSYVLSILSLLILISIVLIVLGTYTGRKYKKSTLIFSISSIVMLIVTIIVYIYTIIQISDVSIGSLFGEGIIDINIPESSISQEVQSSWGPGIGFYLTTISLILLLFVANDRYVNIGKFKDGIVKRYPKGRQMIVDGLDEGKKRARIHSFVEVDVSKARKIIKNKKKKGQKISFTAWIIKCIGKAVSEHKQVHAIRYGKRKIVIFDDVDVSVTYDRILKGESIPMIYVIRDTNKKDIDEITKDVRSVKGTVIDERNLVAKLGKDFRYVKIVMRLPKFIRRLIWKKLRKDPFFAKEAIGTVMVSSLGMVGKFPGWATTIGVHPLFIAIFGIVKKQRKKGKKTETREILNITISFDHETLDGAPFTRFLNRFSQLLEEAYFLDKK